MTPLLPGRVVNNRYRIERTLGQGGFGRTYYALDSQRFSKPVVLKEFNPISRGDYVVQKSRELFEREAATLNSLEHPQIPRFYGWFEEEGRLFLVQEFIEGKTYHSLLEERLEEGRAFSEEEVLRFLLDLLPVLDYIHAHNVIHRDITPDNIMQQDGKSKPILIDFGASRYVKSSQSQENLLGTAVGKIGFAPLEQLQTGTCFPSSDLYALAATVVVLLTGKETSELIDPATLSWTWSGSVQVGDRLTAMLTKMLASRPEYRYQTAAEALEMAQSLVNEHRADSSNQAKYWSVSSSSSHPLPRTNPPKTNPWKTMALGLTGMVVVLGVGVGGGWWFWEQRVSRSDLTVLTSPEQQTYEVALEQGTQATRLFEQYPEKRSVLESASSQLKEAIAQLDTLSNNSSIKRMAQETRTNFQQTQGKIQRRLQELLVPKSALEAAAQQAEAAQISFETATNLQTLQQGYDAMNDAILQLESMQSSGDAQVQVHLPLWEAKVETMATQLQREQQAQSQLYKAELVATSAQQKAESAQMNQVAQTQPALRRARQQMGDAQELWEKAIRQVMAVPDDVVRATQRQKELQQNSYCKAYGQLKAQIQSLDEDIEPLFPGATNGDLPVEALGCEPR